MEIFGSVIEWVWDQLDFLWFTLKHRRSGILLSLLGFVVGCLPAPTLLLLQKLDWHVAVRPMTAFVVFTFFVGMGLIMMALYVGMYEDRR